MSSDLWLKPPVFPVFANPPDNSSPMKSQNIGKLLLGSFAGQVCLNRYFANLRTCYTHKRSIKNYLDYFKCEML